MLQKPSDLKMFSRRRSGSKCYQSHRLSELYTNSNQILSLLLPPTTCQGALAFIFPFQPDLNFIFSLHQIFLCLMCPTAIKSDTGCSHYQYLRFNLLQSHTTTSHYKSSCNDIIKCIIFKCVPCQWVYVPPFIAINLQLY